MGLIDALMGNANEVSAETLHKDYGKLLLEDEQIEMGFKLIRDVYIFTNKRLILVDAGADGQEGGYALPALQGHLALQPGDGRPFRPGRRAEDLGLLRHRADDLQDLQHLGGRLRRAAPPCQPRARLSQGRDTPPTRASSPRPAASSRRRARRNMVWLRLKGSAR